MFTTYESTKSGFFSFTSAAIWIGVFNSVQCVCREHEIIRSEYRSGAMLTAYITANALWQFVICFIQTCIIFGASLIFVDYSGEGVLLPALTEYFITLLILTFGADMLGLTISCAAPDPTAAMTVMPFVLIVQLIMGGVLFDLSGWSRAVSFLTFSKWGMNAFGATADFNNERFPLRLSQAFPNVTRLSSESCYEHTGANLLTSWGACLLLTAACYFLCIGILRTRYRGR